ncbi:MAG: hypothetical protein M1837_003213 [Sclerophora amabilis]|nr:MAG: hypothetical protein M1837_003213 [Sclerophora amabilis]
MAVEPSSELSDLPPSIPSTPIQFESDLQAYQSSSPPLQQTRPRLTPQDKLHKYTILLDEDRFTFWDLIKELFRQSPRRRRNFLRCLTNDKEIFRQVLLYDRHRALDLLDWGVHDFKKELDTLSKADDFGRFEPRRGRDFNSLDMVKLSEEVTELPPRLLVMIMTQMLYNRRSLGSNYISALMDLHLHSSGTQKRIVNLLSQVGICTGYRVTLANVRKIFELAKEDIRRLGQADDSISMYDNFEQTEGVREQRIDDNSEFHSVTTGEVIAGREMPTGGLRQDMLDPTIRISRDNVVFSAGNCRDETSIQISKFLIQEAISAAFPNLKSNVYSDRGDNARPLELPILDRLAPSRTRHYSLGPIPFDESSNAGNLSVIENIFKHQYGMADNCFAEQLTLVYGDQKTTQRIRTVKSIRADSEGPFDSHK